MYKAKIYPITEFNELEVEWRLLERGQDMTYFQTYDWNSIVIKHIPKDCYFFEYVFILIEKDNYPVMIAPLLIIKHTFLFINKRGVYIIGRKGYSDYLNFIYDDFDRIAVESVLSEVYSKYGIKKFFFEQLRENTCLINYITDNKVILKKKQTTCVGLFLPPHMDIYMKSLSKNSRQNIRTARNRLSKDGIETKFCIDDVNADKELCLKIKRQRSVVKLAHCSFLTRIKLFVHKCLDMRIEEYIPFLEDIDSKLLTVYCNGTLAAFFSYGIDNNKSQYIVMTAGVVDDYSKYSPGILSMIYLIENCINEQSIKYIDFTRGDEKYKFALGGEKHYIYDLTFKLLGHNI